MAHCFKTVSAVIFVQGDRGARKQELRAFCRGELVAVECEGNRRMASTSAANG